MPGRYDTEEIIEQLAAEHGCSNGSCGYDFDSECYWWLQGKVQAEIEQREREAEAAKYARVKRKPPRNIRWEEPNSDQNIQDFIRTAREQFRENFADKFNSRPHQFRINIGTNNIFFGGTYGDELMEELNQYLKTGRCDDWERRNDWGPVHIEIEVPTLRGSSDPFADGIGNTVDIVLENMDIPLHGGFSHGRVVHINGPVLSHYTVRAMKPSPPIISYKMSNFIDYAFQAEIVEEHYQLVLIENSPHYFYIPKA